MSTLSMTEQMQEFPKSLACTDCKQAGSRQTLATLGVRDWQGTLVCICRQCYTKRPRPLPKSEASSASSGDGTSLGTQAVAKHGPAILDFDSFQTRSWRLRKTNAKSALRVQCFQQAQKQLEKEENVSQRQHRQRLFQAARDLAMSLVCSVQRLDVFDRKEVEAALRWWAAEQTEIHSEPSHIPSLQVPSALLPDSAAHYLAQITDVLSEFFLCRKYDTYVVCLGASARSLERIFFSIRGCC